MKSPTKDSKLFHLKSNFAPTGDQPAAIAKLAEFQTNEQVLLGATGTGKTFTIANVIQKVQLPTVVIAHNKTLAGQLYQELKELFPNNAVEYFISYFDFYQPEAYLPAKGVYIEKSATVNEEIKRLRVSTLHSLSTRKDVIVVGSVASIYPTSSPADFAQYSLWLVVGKEYGLSELKTQLIHLNYVVNKQQLTPGKFRFQGDVVEVFPGYAQDYVLRLSFFDQQLEQIARIDPLTNKVLETLNSFKLGPADEYIVNQNDLGVALDTIKAELKDRLKYFERLNFPERAQRLQTITEHDLADLKAWGVCSGVENYARHLEHRPPHSKPYNIFDYFTKGEWLLVVDESHQTLPQIKGMYNTDISRKQSLIEYGFRLPSALDNRPLSYEEFRQGINKVIYVSATPREEEIQLSHNNVVEQLVRPTYLLDPEVIVKPKDNQVEDLVSEIINQRKHNGRTFVTVLTIKMAENLTDFLKERNIKVAYIHKDIKALERLILLTDLRKGEYECLVGINLLREGLDVPEVSLVAIFDADIPGLPRDERSLIQIIGRAARNVHGRVIMYANTISEQMDKAIKETQRRRTIQMAYNEQHHKTPMTVQKPITLNQPIKLKTKSSEQQKAALIKQLTKEMKQAAANQNYELAIEIRDSIFELEKQFRGKIKS
ncbi:excinuclease ABC subunit UvrB [Mycoplasmoides pneumoniae]|uniref:UvrABC system protein B n=4 Tax=Mycoplasmoides pneumoniae TaxID=2104 RepID=UVRB_MYCPN|nr:excinuclease ABC subunit UvrB [Mycoplasmoides pneumoniae]P75558.1 RecName: Full=UvrABC system protein B; Short=Protein UvrB; AltName: Full=Excinuclease ABC subunit B [Mycoplasmoides pneumoniae M129]AAB96268.1 excinuclease ABC subunit B [Mycoplasmoides pneumoniae M129]ADK86990.1 excinuclease ABC, B subunit [Mycoplasmoides pneumoniae FH]AGC04136.1 excinuclease ABC subunit B [Mycoplasmoides pneumoniae M129-B7]ALA30096.1 excinuclease ABC subunit B [Mycoplasmoides pneumoniae PI 1428]ALA31051.1 